MVSDTSPMWAASGNLATATRAVVYVILDQEKKNLERFRVEYDVEKAASKILDAGLPEFLAHRLSRGDANV